uniref:Uncharacterized protein n=1 Tax=Aegilops tauschii subsp. strangulata TaxID=200361 RepID=A0A453R223_AEGTS
VFSCILTIEGRLTEACIVALDMLCSFWLYLLKSLC